MTAPRDLGEIAAWSLAGPRDEPAVFWRGQTFDRGWQADMAARLTEAVAATGAPPDVTAGFIPRQRPEAAAAFLAMVAARRSMTMIYSYQSVEAMAGDLRKLRTAVLVAHAEDWQEPLISAAREVGAAGISLTPEGEALPVPGIERVKGTDHRPAPQEPSIELLTSGTSGPPKRYPISFGQFQRCMLQSSFKLGDGDGDRRPALVTVPLANISGIYGFIVAFAGRRTVIMEEKFTLPVWQDFVRTHRPQNISGPPALVQMILEAEIPPEDLSSVRFMTMGMGPVDPVIRRKFEARYGFPILPCYGATEFVGSATAMTMDDHLQYGEAKFGSVGRPIRGATLRIRDEESGEVLPAGDGSIGIVEVQIDAVGPDWIRTTDLGRLDADGFLYLHGRADGVIIRGGFKIHPSAIESVLNQHPAVAASAVVGRPHERLGHVPVAAVEARPEAEPPTAGELDSWLRQHLPATNIPADFRIVTELPRTPSLKIRIDAVRELFASASIKCVTILRQYRPNRPGNALCPVHLLIELLVSAPKADTLARYANEGLREQGEFARFVTGPPA